MYHQLDCIKKRYHQLNGITYLILPLICFDHIYLYHHSMLTTKSIIHSCEGYLRERDYLKETSNNLMK